MPGRVIECALYRACRPALRFRIGLCIDIQRHRDVRMPEKARHGTDVHARADHERREGMAQIPKCAFETVVAAELSEIPAQSIRVIRLIPRFARTDDITVRGSAALAPIRF